MRAASASAKLRGNIGPVSRTSRAKTLPGPRTFQYRDPFSTENLPVLSRFDTHASDCDLRSSTLYCLVIARHSFSLLHRSHQTRRTGKHNPPPPSSSPPPHPDSLWDFQILRYEATERPHPANDREDRLPSATVGVGRSAGVKGPGRYLLVKVASSLSFCAPVDSVSQAVPVPRSSERPLVASGARQSLTPRNFADKVPIKVPKRLSGHGPHLPL